MNSRFLNTLMATLVLLATGLAQAPKGEDAVFYRVKQKVTLSDIAPGSHQVRMWVSIPGDDRHQEVLDLEVIESPGTWSIVEDRDRRGRFVRMDITRPSTTSLDVVVAFVLRREPTHVQLDPSMVRPLTETLRRGLRPYLRSDSPHMAVTDTIKGMAEQICGDETNIAIQAAKLLNHVAEVADHYSKDPTKPNCGIGDAAVCIDQGGGCCTDLHSLFIALARARGIPARLQMGYRLREANVGKETDPGYRCWAEYFVPGYGWVPADIVEADAIDGLGKTRWFTGLTARRLWLNEGRDFLLSPDQAESQVNHMSIAYAEIDGKVARILPDGDLKPQITRVVSFEELPSFGSLLPR
jgi:transglutaminase-like putative cysteine protease